MASFSCYEINDLIVKLDLQYLLAIFVFHGILKACVEVVIARPDEESSHGLEAEEVHRI